MSLWWLLFVGCPKPPPEAPPETFEMPSQAVEAPARAREVGPGPWSADGLSLDIPQGWSGVAEVPDSEVLLSITRSDLGTNLVVSAFDGAAPALADADCEALLTHAGAHRAVPALGRTTTSSCVRADGTLVQAWDGSIEGRTLRVSLVHPPTTAYAGRLAAESLMRALAVSATPAARPPDPSRDVPESTRLP